MQKTKPATKLFYAIEPDYADEIRRYVDEINCRTGITKQRIVSDLIVAGMKRKKFCLFGNENKENKEKF